LSLHRYLYAYANPTVYVDPDGRLGVFFDGTDQDRSNPETINDQALTNVALLAELYENEREYFRGIGTGGSVNRVCSVIGCGFQARIDEAYEAIVELYNRSDDIEDRRLDIFGFSRGAALSVGLVEKLLREGIPVKRRVQRYTRSGRWEVEEHIDRVEADIRFVGLFDTVAARDWPRDPGSIRDILGLWTGTTTDPLKVRWSEVNGEVRHAVAAQEYRSTFDLISLRNCPSCSLPDNVREEVFLGAHSNVGGGYGLSDGGNELAAFPLSYIYSEALESGVPLREMPNLLEVNAGLYSEFFRLIHKAHDSRFPSDKLSGRFGRTIYFGGANSEGEYFDSFQMLQWALGTAKRIDPNYIRENSDRPGSTIGSEH